MVTRTADGAWANCGLDAAGGETSRAVLAADRGSGGLGAVDLVQACLAEGQTGFAGGEQVEVPEVGEDDAAAEGEALVEGLFERGQRWKLVLFLASQAFDCSVPWARGYEGGYASAALLGELNGSCGPEQGVVATKEGGMDEDEGAQVEMVAVEKGGGVGEMAEGHSLVQKFKGSRVGGFQAHGDLEAAG